jgi:hypothetical protein
MKQNVSNILYLAFRLAPFILVSFFTLQSLFNWDLKGIIYLIGLILASFITVIFGKGRPFEIGTNVKNFSIKELPNAACNIITLGDDGDVLSTLPLSVVVYSYTFFYLLVFMLNLANTTNNKGVLNTKSIKQSKINEIMIQNLPVLIIFPLLILFESVWIISNRCLFEVKPIISIVCASLIGSGVGVLWAMFVTYLNKPELQYINKGGLEVCNQPSKMVYRCRALNKAGEPASTVGSI